MSKNTDKVLAIVRAGANHAPYGEGEIITVLHCDLENPRSVARMCRAIDEYYASGGVHIEYQGCTVYEIARAYKPWREAM